MSVRGKLASALGRNDERPNVELAEALVAKPDKAAIAELATLLTSGSAAQQDDAIRFSTRSASEGLSWSRPTLMRSSRCSAPGTTAMSGVR